MYMPRTQEYFRYRRSTIPFIPPRPASPQVLLQDPPTICDSRLFRDYLGD